MRPSNACPERNFCFLRGWGNVAGRKLSAAGEAWEVEDLGFRVYGLGLKGKSYLSPKTMQNNGL